MKKVAILTNNVGLRPTMLRLFRKRLYIPDKEELTHGLHPKVDYALLVLRNLFVAVAVIFFVTSFFAGGAYNLFKAVGYFVARLLCF